MPTLSLTFSSQHTSLFSYQSSKPIPGVAKRKIELQGFPLQGKAKLAAARSCRQPWVSPPGTAGQRGHGAWERTDHVPFRIFPPSSTRSPPRHKPLRSRLCLWGNIPRGRGRGDPAPHSHSRPRPGGEAEARAGPGSDSSQSNQSTIKLSPASERRKLGDVDIICIFIVPEQQSNDVAVF